MNANRYVVKIKYIAGGGWRNIGILDVNFGYLRFPGPAREVILADIANTCS